MANDDDPAAGHGGGYEDFGLEVFVLGLTFGIFARTVFGKKLKTTSALKNFMGLFNMLPYTVWLLLFGAALGFVNSAFPDNQMHSSIEIWQQIDAHVLLFVFLPALLFESSFSVDVHIMRHEALQIFCLAVPGVIFSASLTAMFVKFLLPSMSWSISFLLGSILAATDPVAVVALLKDMGVDERLGTLIEGESLMNDGSAIVLYTIFSKAIMNTYCCELPQIITWALRLSLGGPILGIFIGYVVVWLLEWVKNDRASEITLTIVAAYSAFLVAEGTELKVSGVLAVVFLGLYLSEFAVFSTRSEVGLRSFWHIVEYIADTLVFIVSGLIVADTMWSGDIEPEDWGVLFLLYIALHLIRLLNVLLCWPVLKSKAGYGKRWDYKEGAVLVFAGLRGTVGLALALIAEDSLKIRGKKDDDLNASLIIFNVAGIVFLTLLINGSLMNPLIHLVKLDRVTNAEDELFKHSCARVEILLQQHCDEVLKTDLFLGDAQYQLVWRCKTRLSNYPAPYV